MVSSLWINKIRSFAFVLIVLVMAGSPVYTALAEMQATPIVEPTPTVEPETPEPTEPDGTPDTKPEESGIFTPQGVIDVDDNLSECKQSEETVFPTGSYTINCTYEFTMLVGIGSMVEVTRPDLPDGFTSSVKVSYGRDTVVELGHDDPEDTIQVRVGLVLLITNYEVDLAFEIKAAAGSYTSAGKVTLGPFSACRKAIEVGGIISTTCEQAGSVFSEIEVVQYPLSDEEYPDLSCTDAEPESVSLDAVAISNCEVTVGTDVAPLELQLNEIVINLDDQAVGWSSSLANLDAQLPVQLPAGKSFQFQVGLTPTSCAAGDFDPTAYLYLNLTPMLDGEPIGNPVNAPRNELVSTRFDPPPPSENAVISSVKDPNHPVPYNMTSVETRNGSFTLKSTVGGCVLNPDSESYEPYEGATFITMSEFEWVQSELGTQQPPVGSNVPHLIRNSHGISNADDGMLVTEIAFGDTTIFNDQPTLILTTSSETGGLKSVEHTINLEYTIPANTPVGEYTSTITVTTSAGPD